MANMTAIKGASSSTIKRSISTSISIPIPIPNRRYLYSCLFSSFTSTSVDYSDTTTTKKNTSYTGRLTAVIDAANDRKLPLELRGNRNNVRSETDIINVVEQRIWKSMEEGHFENLSGKGKPLDLKTNPHADPAEDTLYRILSNNGCAPEWIELNKQIRTEASEWRLALQKAFVYKMNGNYRKWSECCETLKVQMTGINNKVFKYNLVAPFGRQMVGIKWEKELDRLKES